MRALIISLAAAGVAISSLSGYAGDELSRAKLEQPGRTADDEPQLKSAGTSSKAARAIDEDAPLKSAGATSRLSRAAADDDQPLKSTGTRSKAGRAIDEDAPLKPAGASSKAQRKLDEDVVLKSFRAASRPGPATPRERESRINRK